MGDLVRFIVARNPELVTDEPKQWTRERVAFVVRHIVLDALGVSDFDEDDRFVEDLGLS